MSDNRILDFHKGTNKEKADPKFGLLIAKSIDSTIQSGFNGYYLKRNKKIERSRKIAAGEQDMAKFLDLMNIDGKNSFVNVDLTPPMIAPKFLDIICQRFMERDEHASAEAVDPVSINKKDYSKKEAEYRMENKDLINNVQQQAGVPVEDPSAYVPDDKDDLEFHFGYEYQLPEEIRFEKGIDWVLMDNDWSPVRKRKTIENLMEAGLAGARTYIDVNGLIKVRECKPENLFYSWSEQNDFRDLTYCGELYKMKVPEYRARFAKDYIKAFGEAAAEQNLFDDIKKAASDSPGYNSLLTWNSDWNNAMFRPYDDWEIEVMDFEFKTVDNDYYTAKTNSYGKLIAVDKKDKKPKEVSDNKEVVVKQVNNIYRGYYVRRLGKLFCWELMQNMIRPQSNLSDVYFSFCLYMPKNRKMNNRTMCERMETSINNMTLALLKIQVLMAKLRPPGIAVDINGLNDLDLGLGGGQITPLELMKVYDQTGNVWYRSFKEDGETRQQMPITELPNGASIAQFQQLIAVYNFNLERLRQDVGTNEYTEGQAVNPKLGLGVMDNQVAASNRANEFIYEGYLSIMQNVCRNIAILLWDNVMFGGQAYRHIVGDEALDDKRFDVNVEMLPDEQQQQRVDAQVQAALTAGLIDFQDAFKINNIRNIKLKELYLSRAQKKKRQQTNEDNQANIQATSQAQQASAAATSQAKQQELQLEYQGKMAVMTTTNKGASDLSLQNWVQEMLTLSFEQNRPLPPNIQDIVNSYFEDKANQEQDQAEATDQIMQQQQQEQGQSQQGQPQPDQMPQQQVA
jgi:hypothetical protein